MAQGDTYTKACRIEFENGVSRETQIGFFVERALEDPEATVFRVDDGEPVTEMSEATEVVA